MLLIHDARDQRYLAHLFLGGLAEAQNQMPQAVVHYREALALLPDAQAARIALAQAMDRSDERDGMRAVLEPLLAHAAPRPETDDPWWMYPFGALEWMGPLRDRLRAVVAVTGQ